MKNQIKLLCLCLVMIACNSAEKNKTAENNEQLKKSEVQALNNYAVVWTTPNSVVTTKQSETSLRNCGRMGQLLMLISTTYQTSKIQSLSLILHFS